MGSPLVAFRLLSASVAALNGGEIGVQGARGPAPSVPGDFRRSLYKDAWVSMHLSIYGDFCLRVWCYFDAEVAHFFWLAGNIVYGFLDCDSGSALFWMLGNRRFRFLSYRFAG